MVSYRSATKNIKMAKMKAWQPTKKVASAKVKRSAPVLPKKPIFRKKGQGEHLTNEAYVKFYGQPSTEERRGLSVRKPKPEPRGFRGRISRSSPSFSTIPEVSKERVENGTRIVSRTKIV